MIIKVIVSPEEKVRIKEMAAGGSVSSFVKRRALGWTEQDHAPLVRLIEANSSAANRINEIATTVLADKAIYETEILELLDRMTTLEATTADFLKEVSHDGHAGQ